MYYGIFEVQYSDPKLVQLIIPALVGHILVKKYITDF